MCNTMFVHVIDFFKMKMSTTGLKTSQQHFSSHFPVTSLLINSLNLLEVGVSSGAAAEASEIEQ